MGTTNNFELERTAEADGRKVEKRPAKSSCVDCEEEDNDVDVVVEIKKNTTNLVELYLCSGDGSNSEDYILSLIFDYVDFKEAAICSMLCKRFGNNITQSYWPKAEKELHMIVADSDVLLSPSARNSMERVVRYRNASEEANRIASRGDFISKHVVVPTISELGELLDYQRVSNCCSGCDFFPQQLNFDMLGPYVDIENDNYELFVRFSRTIDNFLFSEGFIDYPNIDGEGIDLNRFDFSKWQKFIDVTSLIGTEGENFIDPHKEQLIDCMKELTITVVAVHTITSRANLVLAQCNFGVEVDMINDMGYCSPKGKLFARSHSPIQTIQGHDGDREYIESTGQLGMIFTYTQNEDQENEDQHLPPVCVWNLIIDVDFRETTHSLSDDISDYNSDDNSEIGYNGDRNNDDY